MEGPVTLSRWVVSSVLSDLHVFEVQMLVGSLADGG